MSMDIGNSLVCPNCNKSFFQIKREATYIYTYEVNSPEAESVTKNPDELPYLFETREQLSENEYLLCKNCGEKYPCTLDKGKNNISLTILQKALRSEHQKVPEYLG